MEKKLFSIAIVSYNQRDLIEDCIDSILEQTYENIELIVCDDCSYDFNIEEVKAYIEKNKKQNISNVIVYKQKKNVGTSANCQKAMELANGDYFKLQAGDDMLYEAETLEKIAKLFDKNPYNVIIGRAQACTHEGQKVEAYYPPYDNFLRAQVATSYELFEMMSTRPWGAFVCAPAVFWRLSFLKKFGGFDLSYKYTEDWPLWLKICSEGYDITYIDQITTIYRYGGISNGAGELNQALGKAHYQECIRMLKEQGMPELKKKHSKLAQLRCWCSIKCIEARMTKEYEWNYWRLRRKIGWRIKNINFLILVKLFHVRNLGIYFDKKRTVLFMILFACVAYWNQIFYHETKGMYLFALLFFLSGISLLGKIIIYALFQVMQTLGNFRLKRKIK
ncbi:glycosyltransferase [uncultured Clostridium sp.]|jgi:glycosyltransferase involved in cell wall biosynthesis|uniref:glycosyltransferase n=1 Tax=uncultured Clostridium sp. TaxID=59620 RepID=UPI0026DBAC0F|nr:glycosyltransferase [uncultured Clostridium sp.]